MEEFRYMHFGGADEKYYLINHYSRQESLLAGYTKAKLDKFNEDLNPSLAMVTDWIISSGNTPLSVDMMVGSLDLMQRDDIIEVIQKGRGEDEIIEFIQKGRAGKKNMASCLQAISAKLRSTSRVSIDDSHWPSYTTRKCKFVTTRVVNLAKYGHDFTMCFITRILIRCYCISFLNKLAQEEE